MIVHFLCMIFLSVSLSATHIERHNVLIIYPPTPVIGGGEIHCAALQESLKKNGHNVHVLIRKKSPMIEIFKKNSIEYFCYGRHRAGSEKHIKKIRAICTEKNVDLIMCNAPNYLHACNEALKGLSSRCKLVFFEHVHPQPKRLEMYLHSYKNLTAVFCSSRQTAKLYEAYNKQYCLGIRHTEYIPPFFNEDKFFNVPMNDTQSKKDFFYQSYALNIDSQSVFCMIANMYPDGRKNHKLLFEALKKVIYDYKRDIFLILVGSGAQMLDIKGHAQALGLGRHVYFLGSSDQIPKILQHVDFHVLSSTYEAFGLVHVEAAMMKKPSIGAFGTGAEDIIVNGETGLLFKPDDADDLAAKIMYLLDDKEQCKKMGEQAYVRAMNIFLNDQKLAKILQLISNH